LRLEVPADRLPYVARSGWHDDFHGFIMGC